MKQIIEYKITDCKFPKVTITPDRITIKYNGGDKWEKHLNFLKEVSEKHLDTDCALRGSFKPNNNVRLFNNAKKLVAQYNLIEEVAN